MYDFNKKKINLTIFIYINCIVIKKNECNTCDFIVNFTIQPLRQFFNYNI